MSVTKYVARGRTLWAVDTEVKDPSGRVERFRRRRIPSKEKAEALEAKIKTEAFEGRYFDKRPVAKLTVEELWKAWEPATRQKNDSWQTDVGRAAHLVRHLGSRVATDLTVEVVPWYREERLREITRRGAPPTPATLNREVALLRRLLEYAVECRKLAFNPIGAVSLLKENNIRRVLVSEANLVRLLECAEPQFRAILLVAYDTGMRLQEVLQQQRAWLDIKRRRLVLPAEYTKAEEARPIRLTRRTIEAIEALPIRLESPYLFVNPETGTRWKNTRRMWKRAAEAAGIEEAWFHDLRRSFITNARRRGIPERVVMKMSGHRTRSVFDRYNVVEERDIEEAAKLYEQGAEEELRESEAAARPGGEGKHSAG